MRRRPLFSLFSRFMVRVSVLGLIIWCPAAKSFSFGFKQTQRIGNPTVHASLLSEQEVDRRPHEQRATSPRLARRLNHGFRYLYRQNNTHFQNMTSLEYLSIYYPKDEIYRMNQSFPPLLELNVSRHLHPKM